jgi:hypothetical protein
MANPLFNQFGNNGQINELIKRAQEMKKNFNGNPKEEVERLLNSGQMTQAQFNEFSQIAHQVITAMRGF